MLKRVLVACSFVGLFALGYFVGHFGKLPVANSTLVSAGPNVPAEPESLVLITSTTILEDEPEDVVPENIDVELVADSLKSKRATPINRIKSSTPVEIPSPVAITEQVFITDEKLVKDLEYQLLYVDRLRTRIADLEWETLVLQSDLLSRDIELANVKSEISRNYTAQPEIFNITNVPVGGYVVATPSAVTASPTPSLVQQPDNATLEGVAGSKQNATQTGFFGPAPDEQEDHSYFESAVTPHQSQETQSAIQEDRVNPPNN